MFSDSFFSRASALLAIICASAVRAQPTDSTLYYFPGPDLRKDPELSACNILEKVFSNNPLLDKVDYKDDCLSTVFNISSCDSYSDYLYEDGECAKNRRIYIKLSKESDWIPCRPRKIGESSYSRVLACGGGLRLTGSVPSIARLAALSAEIPQYSESYQLGLSLSNSNGERDTAYPYYSLVTKMEIGNKPIVRKDNLTYKYYFPSRLQVISKYLLDGGNASLYLKSEADAMLYLGSRDKRLIN